MWVKPARPRRDGEGALRKHPRKHGGEGGIRTRGRRKTPYNGLAIHRLRPLGHLSAIRTPKIVNQGACRCLWYAAPAALPLVCRALRDALRTHSVRVLDPRKRSDRIIPSSLCDSRSSKRLWHGAIECAMESLAEGVGFEPTDLSVNGFQDRRNRPLCHPSARLFLMSLPYRLNTIAAPARGAEPPRHAQIFSPARILAQGAVRFHFVRHARFLAFARGSFFSFDRRHHAK